MQRAAFAAALLALAAAGLEAQTADSVGAARRFSVTPSVGAIHWDNSSALANKTADAAGTFNKTTITPTAGLTAVYNVWRNAGVGFYFEAARPTTRGDYFPALLLQFGNTVELRNVSQRVTVMMYGLQGQYGFDIGRIAPFIQGGIGAVTVNTDPQQNTGNKSFSNSAAHVGGGLAFSVGQGRVSLDVRDHMFFSWKRDKLNPVGVANQNTLFPSANGNPPAAKGSLHNLRVSLGFTFTPRLGTSEGSEEGTTTGSAPEE